MCAVVEMIIALAPSHSIHTTPPRVSPPHHHSRSPPLSPPTPTTHKKPNQDQRPLLINELQRQAQTLTTATLSMPTRVEKIGGFLDKLQGGDVRLRVRVLEAERAARRAQVMQTVTLQAVGVLGLANMGLQLVLAGQSVLAGVAFVATGALGVGAGLGLRRVKRLDKFEKQIKG